MRNEESRQNDEKTEKAFLSINSLKRTIISIITITAINFKVKIVIIFAISKLFYCVYYHDIKAWFEAIYELDFSLRAFILTYWHWKWQ
jgi:hypothetical protein